jgi:Uma2 family endonuclease
MSLPAKNLSLEAYLAWEEKQAERHEFYRGEIFAMASGSRAHAEVCGNVFAALRSHVKGTSCRAYTDAATVQVQDDMVFYPDAFVTCNADDLETKRIFRNPTLIVEVLSESTEAFNRGLKFIAYRQILALQEYLLIDPERQIVEVFRRKDNDVWEVHNQSAAAFLHLASIDLQLPMAELFDGVKPQT